MFLDWKNQYCENDCTTQSNLQIQCNPYQTTNGILHKIRTKNFTVRMETQKTPNSQSNLFCNFFKNLFIYLFNLFMAVLGLRFFARAFSSCGKWGPLFITVRGPLTIVASLLRNTGSRRTGSAIVAPGPSHSAACGIFPDQGSNPCPLQRQADSQPLRHQGSP